jgi:hypothetical protein
MVVLDVPDGQPDMVLIKGEWQTVPDGRALLPGLKGHPVTVICGIDPLVVTGEKPCPMSIRSRLPCLERQAPGSDAKLSGVPHASAPQIGPS